MKACVDCGGRFDGGGEADSREDAVRKLYEEYGRLAEEARLRDDDAAETRLYFAKDAVRRAAELMGVRVK